MQLALGILLLVSFLVFIVYAAKGGNLMMGLFVMAVLWCAIGAIGGVVTWEDINTTVFNQGPLDFGSTAVNIIFGSWFGRILVETGIAGTIIRKAVELGGDKPGLTTSLLCIVTTAIFTTAYGVGAVIAIGVIVFPILLSLGISKPLAAAAYTMSVGAGLYFNSSLLNQAAGVMVVNDEQYTLRPMVPLCGRGPGHSPAGRHSHGAYRHAQGRQKPCLGGFCRQHDHGEKREPAGLPDAHHPRYHLYCVWRAVHSRHHHRSHLGAGLDGLFQKLERHW